MVICVIFNLENAKFLPILAHFDQFWLLRWEFVYFLAFFFTGLITWRCTKMDKYEVLGKELRIFDVSKNPNQTEGSRFSKCVVSIWALPGGYKGLPGWFGALFLHFCPGV